MKILIGEILLEYGFITEEQLEYALELQKKQDKKELIGMVLLQLGHINEEQLEIALMLQTIKTNGLDNPEFIENQLNGLNV